MSVAAQVDAFKYAAPRGEDEMLRYANANAYEWAYLDTCRENSEKLRGMGQVFPADQILAKPVPDGWAPAWLEYNRRNPSRMAIREAFRMWRDTGMLPGLD